ncbi:MAG: hypothetical protein ACODAB_09845 [Gemmatimonadota bacterium]
MAKRQSAGGVLDLSGLAEAPQKVKLPDQQLYSMANPAELGILPQQQLIARYRRAQELMGRTDATPEDADELIEMLLDVCQVVLPDAPREVIGRLGLSSLDRLVQAFLAASGKDKSHEAGDAGGATGETATSAT